VDLARYQGKWHEIARLPAWFQRGCTDTTAFYKILEPGTVSVRNECVTESGKRKSTTGTARVTDPETNAKLKVVFDNWFSRLFSWLMKANYWILYVDPEYHTALVGTPDRKYLWILARTPTLSDATYAALVDRCRTLGFDTTRLIKESP
jgi:apolipoprotein D and lipocalin family protein